MDFDESLGIAVGIIWLVALVVAMLTEDLGYRFKKGPGRSAGVSIPRTDVWAGWRTIHRVASGTYWTITICGGLVVAYLSFTGKI